jgi:prepilin-type N-terminal cleavage/methylation domain-containing protein
MEASRSVCGNRILSGVFSLSRFKLTGALCPERAPAKPGFQTTNVERTTVTGVRRNRRGFTLVEIMIVVSIVGLLAGVGVPSLVKARTETQRNLCIGNLRVIDGAKEQWALINSRTQGEPVEQNEVDALVRKGVPQCPAAGSYTYGAVGEAPTCSLAEDQGHILAWASPQEDTQDETEEEEEEEKKEKKGKGKGRGKGRGGRG